MFHPCPLLRTSFVCATELKVKHLRVPQYGQHSPSATVALAQEMTGQEILLHTVAEFCKGAHTNAQKHTRTHTQGMSVWHAAKILADGFIKPVLAMFTINSNKSEILSHNES